MIKYCKIHQKNIKLREFTNELSYYDRNFINKDIFKKLSHHGRNFINKDIVKKNNVHKAVDTYIHISCYI